MSRDQFHFFAFSPSVNKLHMTECRVYRIQHTKVDFAWLEVTDTPVKITLFINLKLKSLASELVRQDYSFPLG